MGSLLVRTLPLAVGAAISPTLLLVVVLLLSGRTRPRARATAFATGNVFVLAALSVVVLLVFNSARHVHTGPTRIGAAIDFSFGLLILVFGLGNAIEFFRTGASPAPAPVSPTGPGKNGLAASHGQLGAWLLGVGLMATNFTTIALFLDVLKDAAEARVGTLARAVDIAVVIVIAMVPVLIPLGISMAAPSTSDRVLSAINRFVTQYRHLVTAVFFGAIGLYLTLKGASW